MKIRLLIYLFFASLLFFSQLSISRNKSTFDITSHGLGFAKPGTVTWNVQALQGYNMRVWMNNSLILGKSAFEGSPPPGWCGSTGIGLAYPYYACVEHLFGGGPWVGAVINGTRYVTEIYNGDAGDGELIPQQADSLRSPIWHTSVYDTLLDPNRPGYYKRAMNRAGFDDDGDGKIDTDPLDGIDNDGDWNPLTDDIGADGVPDSLEVGCKGSYDPVTNPDPAFDNYEPAKYDSCHPLPNGTFPRKNNKDKYTEKNGLQDHGEPHVDEDGAAISPSDYYAAATDTFRFPVITRHHKMGLKIYQKSYAWEAGTAADAILLFDYTMINISKNNWQDAYIAMFLDPDIGPVSNPSYYINNYSAFDPATVTAYAANPVDSGSTPLGLTLLGQSKKSDSLKLIFQWSDFTAQPGPGTNDSLIYSWMSGEHGLIAPNQPSNQLSDTRFFISSGPFQMAAGDTIISTYALISGKNIADMLNNARRAHEIYDHRGFLMPTASIIDSGGTHPIRIAPKTPGLSPYADITTYRYYYGTASGNYTDSVTSPGPITINRSVSGQVYYIAMQAIDQNGNVSGLSDELTTLPTAPQNVQAIDGELSIKITWDANTEFDLAGYNLYRYSPGDSLPIKLNHNLLTQTQFVDSTVWGNKVYYYFVTGVDIDGHESRYSMSAMGRLIPPASPKNFVIGPAKTSIKFIWDSNTEGDLRGYNIYRADSGNAVSAKLNSAILLLTRFTDSTATPGKSYDYYLEAVDTTDAASDRVKLNGKTATFDQGILVVNFALRPFADTLKSFYSSLLKGYQDTILTVPAQSPPPGLPTLGKYSAVVWLHETYPLVINLPLDYAKSLKGYLLGGGKLLVMGRKLPYFLDSTTIRLSWYPFLSDLIGIDLLTKNDTASTFAGAMGSQGFASVALDQVKLAASNGKLSGVDRLSGVSAGQVIYTYHTDPVDPILEGKPVGAMTRDTSYHAYYMSFPLYYLDFTTAQSLISKVLSDFGIVLGVGDKRAEIPKEYHLYQAYPNPFNPTTTIRFDLPAASNVSLKIYDVLGREVGNLADGRRQAGRYEVQWNAASYASGVYFYRLQTERYIETKKLLLMK
ncbi:MAG: T9SS type A sorting domain-containing protein [Bacteroidota bacterium]